MGAILPKRFDLVRLLRKDRASSTFIATDQRLGLNEVVVKIIGRGNFAGDTTMVRDVLSWHRGLRHPYISDILDAGLTAKHDLFYVRACHPASDFFATADMESLKTLVAGVDFLHARGRTHGGIRPSNVFRVGGVAQLADPWIGHKKALTEEDVRFTAPEVLSGGALSFESDLYSLGAVLYRFFSRRDPFEDSDLESLKAKYIWASPRPLASVSHVSKAIGDIVTNLTHKDPNRRKPAFDALKEELDVQPKAASRAPAVGLDSQLDKAIELLLGKPKLRVVLVEGPPGSGKTRFVEELRSRAGFCPEGRVITVCEAIAPTPYVTLGRRLVSVVDEQSLNVGAPALARLRDFIETNREPLSKVEQEPIDRDLLSLLASIGRQAFLLLVIDDIDRGSRKMSSLLESIVKHGSELDLAILVTCRPDGLSSRTAGALTDFLGESFRRILLEPLCSADVQALSEFVATDQDRMIHAQLKAGGKPAFLEEYCKNPKPSAVPKRVKKTLASMIVGLSSHSRPLAQVLALFDQPIDLSVLSRIIEITEPELREPVDYLKRMGLVDFNKLVLRYLDARPLLHSRIPRAKLAELHALAFQCLKDTGCPESVLARHAFHGGLFERAGMLYLKLARDRFSAKDYRAAADCYSLVSECSGKNQGASSLDPEDKIRLAKCHSHRGNRGRARTILEHLLQLESIPEDSELLSSVYEALASPFIVNSVEERIRLLRLAIDCLPMDSPQLSNRYLALAVAFLSAGDTVSAGAALEAAGAYRSSQDMFTQSEAVRSALFMHQGRFRDAARCLSEGQFMWAMPGMISNNLAVCLEQLGDLRRARDLELRAFQEGESSGSLFVQILSLGNLGSMESKLGNFAAAEKFFQIAIGRLTAFKRQDKNADIPDLGIIHSDAALHFIQRGDYRKAKYYLSTINRKYAGPFPFEVFLVVISRCELNLALGNLEVARQLLDGTNDLPVSGEFFEIERLLVEVRLRAASVELSHRLEQALENSRRLESRYQECRILIALATVRLSIDVETASGSARVARRIARANGYRLLAARAVLLMGLSAKRDAEREFGLEQSLREAAEIGLAPMVAESALRMGEWRYSLGDYITARDYLSKSVAITARLAENLDAGDRRKYLSLAQHRSARTMLGQASAKAEVMPVTVPELVGRENSYFMRLYRLTALMTAAVDLSAATATLLAALRQSNHYAIVVLGSGPRAALHPVRAILSDEARKRVLSVAQIAGEKAYITGVGRTGKRDIAVWLPIVSLALQGGIYVESVTDRAGLDEMEIEFLTLVAAISGAAFDRLCSKADPQGAPYSSEFLGIVGSSHAIGEVRTQIEIAAANTANVLIEGESGTGKELVAKAIHGRSRRANAPFVPVDCGALPEGLIEAELFGAKRGAYTGAIADRPGLFEAADHGTIFLDEISNLGLAAQAKLLRVLQEREVRRIGSMTGRLIDVRLIAATNCNLEKLAREGKFRQDLLYRLKVLHIPLPPLRNRKSDIPALATKFLERLNNANQTKKYFGPGVLDRLFRNDYPGNVRELQNVVERAFYSTTGPVMTRIDSLTERGLTAEQDEMERWFKDLTEGRKNFWSAIHDRYKRRDISRERVVALMDMGLRAARGNYKTMAAMFQIRKEEYRRFMDFLRRNQCLLDFRPYRKIE